MLFRGNHEIDFNKLTVQYVLNLPPSQSFPFDPNQGSSEHLYPWFSLFLLDRLSWQLCSHVETQSYSRD